MKVVYTKRHVFKLFDIVPLWTWREDYLENSRDGDDDDGKIDIELKERILEQ